MGSNAVLRVSFIVSSGIVDLELGAPFFGKFFLKSYIKP